MPRSNGSKLVATIKTAKLENRYPYIVKFRSAHLSGDFGRCLGPYCALARSASFPRSRACVARRRLERWTIASTSSARSSRLQTYSPLPDALFSPPESTRLQTPASLEIGCELYWKTRVFSARLNPSVRSVIICFELVFVCVCMRFFGQRPR